jgi:DNA-binding NarL/FixJ family response regulator
VATASGEWPLTGRDKECAVLADLGSAAVIVGPPGVGRTRLAREVLAVASAAGRATAWAAGTEAGRAVPMGALAHLLPADPAAPTDPFALLQRAHTELGGGRRPLTLVVDDAHLLDDLSTALLPQLAADPDIALVVTTHPARGRARLAPLWKDGTAVRMELDPLDRADTERLLAAALPGELDAHTAERLWALTRGNPLYLHELVDAGRRSGELTGRDGVWRWPGEIVASRRLTDLVLAQLGELRPAELAALEAVAAAEPVLLDRLGPLVDLDAVAALERRGAVVVDGRGLARTAHPVHAAVLRAVTPWARAVRIRAELHRDAAGLVAEARAANARLDHSRAEEHARAALEAGAGLDAHRELVEALRWLAAPAEVADAVEAARGVGADPDAQAHLAVVAATALAHGAARCAEAEKLLAGLAPSSPAATAQVTAAAALVAAIDGRPAASLELAGSVPAGAAAPMAAAAATAALAVTGRTEEALRTARAGWASLPPCPSDTPFDAVVLARAELLALHLSGCAARLAARVAELHRLGTPGADWAGGAIAALHRGQAALDTGDLRVAGRWLTRALAGLDRYDPAGLHPVCAAELARVRALQDDPDEADRLLGLAGTEPAGPAATTAVALAGAWRSATGDDEASALRRLRSAAEHAADRGEPAVEADLRHSAAMLGGAAAEAEPLRALAARTSSRAVGVWAEHAAAVAAGDGARLDAVAGEYERAGARLLAADAAAEAAAAHHRHGDRRRSARSGAVAARLAATCGRPRTPALHRLAPPRLTGREGEVAELVADGLSNAEVAARLVVSVRTVETHLAHAYAKLGVGDRAALAELLRPPGE